MVKKIQKAASPEKKAGGAQLSGTVRESAQQIWLAGLGAFAKAQEEGGKVFEALVKEGTAIQRKTQAAAEEKISEATNRMATMATDISAKASGQWGKLEDIFEERVSKALNKLGVPSAKEENMRKERVVIFWSAGGLATSVLAATVWAQAPVPPTGPSPRVVCETEGPLRAELLPSGNEVLLEPSGKGLARAFLFGRREVHVIEVAVDAAFPEPGPAPSCTAVKDDICYAQFRSHPLPQMVFELAGLQAEARAAQEELDKAGLPQLRVAISPWGVKLTGPEDAAEKRRALRAIWPAILGPLRLDE